MSLPNFSSGRPQSWTAPLLALCLGFAVVGCDNLIDVSNPNNVLGEDLLNPDAAGAVSNSALYTVQKGYGYMLAPYSTVSDELTWIGSRDAWRSLDFGDPTDANNEFTDNAFKYFAQGRWMADEAITILEGHQTSGELEDPEDLARAYLWGAISYTAIAHWFDDFAFSDRSEAGPPIGPANMGGLYDTAVQYATSGLALVAGDDSDLERNLMAMRARARHGQVVWGLIGMGQSGQVPADGLPAANSLDAAAADAAAALAIDPADWRFLFDYGASTVWSDIGWQVVGRLELRMGDRYIVPTADDSERESTGLMDPINNIPDPRLDALQDLFEADERYADLVVTSAKEMHLIMAEDALADGQMGTFQTQINAVRATGAGLTNWTGAGGQPTALNMLIYERQANLYLQGQRLNDMYRFGLTSDKWQAGRPSTTGAVFLPITIVEIRANCHLNPDFECS